MLDATKHISSEAQDYLIDWYTTKPVFGLMGEYSAGKSTLLNLLLDQNALPTKVTATNLPPVWLTYSEVSTCQGLRFDGVLEDVDLHETSEDIRDHYVLLRMGVTSDRLKDADIIDTPGISDPKLEKGALNFLGDYMDFVLWLSAANQAWRQTEKMAWTSFPEILRTNSVMLLTRADKLRNAKDVEKVHKRCRMETAGLFRKIVPLMTTKAAAVADEDRTLDEDSAWVMTGGAALESTIAESLKNVIDARETAAIVHVPKPMTNPTPDVLFTHNHKTSNPDTGWEANTDTDLQSGEKTFSTDISGLNQIGGFIGACLTDADTGLMITSEGGGDTLDLEAIGAAHTEVVKAKLAAIELLGQDEQIDDILITLGGQFHLIRSLTDTPTVFICVALDKQAADLEVARGQLEKVEKTVSL